MGFAGRVFAGLGLLRDGPKRVLRDYMDPHFYFFTLKNERERESEKKAIFVIFFPENISSSDNDDSSSGDDDSRSGDDDSSSSDDDSSSGGILIWFSLFITHKYEVLYYNVRFLV